jgi:ATP-dependent DNA ligase
MVKKLDVPYVFDRSTNVMKLKPIVTYDGVVVEVLEGKEGTKWAGTKSRIRVQLPNAPVSCLTGYETTIVGTGFKDEDRDFLDKNAKNLVGRACEIEGQPPLTEDGKIRFPVFMRMRDASDVDPKVVTAGEAYTKGDA